MIARLIRRGDGSLGAFTDSGSLVGVVVDESAMRAVDEPATPPWWLCFAWALLVLLLVAFFAFEIGVGVGVNRCAP